MSDPTGASRKKHDERKERLRTTLGANNAFIPKDEKGIVERGKEIVSGIVKDVKDTYSAASNELGAAKRGIKKITGD